MVLQALMDILGDPTCLLGMVDFAAFVRNGGIIDHIRPKVQCVHLRLQWGAQSMRGGNCITFTIAMLS